MYNIEQMYNNCLNLNTGTRFGRDIVEHLPTLYRYSQECNHITEMGVRSIFSTWAFLHAKPKRMISYDIMMPDVFGSKVNIDDLVDSARENGTEFEFRLESTLDADIEETDLLFIDTLHTYPQLKRELELHSGKAKKYIIMHDTTLFAHKGEAAGELGLLYALEEFLPVHTEWITKEVYENCNGLTVLERVRG